MKKTLSAILCIAVFLLMGCSSFSSFESRTFFAMNTFITVTSEKAETADEIAKLTEKYEKLFSKTIAESEISRLNDIGFIEASEDTAALLNKAADIANATDGAYNPCMGAVASLWDITSGKNIVPASDAVEKALTLTSFSDLSVDGKSASLLRQGVQVDLGGIAKGYALGKAYEKAIETGEKNFCISFGGNVGVHGSSPSAVKGGKTGWNVGITNPFDKEKTAGVLKMDSGFISISGAYERFFEKDGKIYHHIFDSKTGYPSQSGIACACVISDDAETGDALSTALFVMGKDRATQFYRQQKYDFEMILILEDKSILVSDGLKDKFSLTDTDNFNIITLN